MLHGPSVGIGAAIASVAIIASFLVFDTLNSEEELEIVDQQIENDNPKQITKSVFLDNSSPYLGDKDAPVTLVEFGDYQCFFCNKFFHDTEEKIVNGYVKTGKVKMIFKDYTIIGPDSITAAHAAHCADDQGKFWEYHDTLYNNWAGENNGWASSENLLRFAKDLNLDIEKFTDCMLESRHKSIIQASNEDAKTLGLTGTPGFFVIGPDNNITKIGGAQPYEVFQRIFDSELKK